MFEIIKNKDYKFLFIIGLILFYWIFISILYINNQYDKKSTIEDLKNNYLAGLIMQVEFHKDCTCGFAKIMPPDKKSIDCWKKYGLMTYPHAEFTELVESFDAELVLDDKVIATVPFSFYTKLERAVELPKFKVDYLEYYDVGLRPKIPKFKIISKDKIYYCYNYTITSFDDVSFIDIFGERVILREDYKINIIKVSMSDKSILDMEAAKQKLFQRLKNCKSHHDNFSIDRMVLN